MSAAKSKSYLSRMREQTEGLRSTSEVTDKEVADAPAKPRTAPGSMQALANAELRIKELEAKGGNASKLPVESIIPNPWQPRRHFDPAAMDDLANGIREAGLIQPIIVRRDPSNPERYQIVAGERRWRAHQMLGLSDIKAHVVDLTDSEMAIQAMIENLNREDLSDYETCLAYERIEQEFPSRKATAEAFGISKSQMHRLMSYLKLPKFITTDLDQRPYLLGANAASAIVSVASQMPAEGMRHLEDLWTSMKQGEIDQAKIAPHLTDRLNKKPAGVGKQHVKTYYSEGTKAGDVKRDASNFVIRFKTALLSEDQEQRIKTFLDELFPSR